MADGLGTSRDKTAGGTTAPGTLYSTRTANGNVPSINDRARSKTADGKVPSTADLK